MHASEIRVKQIRVNQGLGVYSSFFLLIFCLNSQCFCIQYLYGVFCGSGALETHKVRSLGPPEVVQQQQFTEVGFVLPLVYVMNELTNFAFWFYTRPLLVELIFFYQTNSLVKFFWLSSLSS